MSNMGNGMVEWTRSYAAKPPTWEDYEAIGYNYIGYYGDFALKNRSSGRSRFVVPVPCRVINSYFLIAASGGDYTDVKAIPLFSAQKYFAVTLGGADVDYDYVGNMGDIANDWSGTLAHDTIPNLTTYKVWVANALANGWNSDPVDPAVTGVTTTPAQLVAEDSKLINFAGNIWQRQTRLVLAQ
jgi:hypothetical protein